MSTATLDEPNLVELHFDLEIDHPHAFEQRAAQVISACIADVLGIDTEDVIIDGVDEMIKGDDVDDADYFGLLRGHIPTTKHAIEQLVSIFYNALETTELQNEIHQRLQLSTQPVLNIREMYKMVLDEYHEDDDDEEKDATDESGAASRSEQVDEEEDEDDDKEDQENYSQGQIQEEPELAELHFELEIDQPHAFEQQADQVITSCIADVSGIDTEDVVIDGVYEMVRGDGVERTDFHLVTRKVALRSPAALSARCSGLFRGHIPTTKREIEQMVDNLYYALNTTQLQNKIRQRSQLSTQPVLDILELYETDDDSTELHFELEVDYMHAWEQTKDQMLTACIADVLDIDTNDVVFDDVEYAKRREGLFRGHILTTKHAIDELLPIFRDALQTRELHRKLHQRSKFQVLQPELKMRDLCEWTRHAQTHS